MEKQNVTGTDFNRSKEIKKEIQDRIINGEQREKIYRDLTSRYHEEYIIAQLIGSISDLADIDSLKKENQKIKKSNYYMGHNKVIV